MKGRIFAMSLQTQNINMEVEIMKTDKGNFQS
jgi:hypothetical protein